MYGKLPPIHDPRTFQVGAALTRLGTPIPLECYYAPDVNFPAWGNLTVGNCGLVAPHAAILSMTATRGGPVESTTQMVMDDYSDVSGYVQNDSSTDHGTSVLKMLKHWQKTGLRRNGKQAGDDRDYITAYGSVNPKDHDACARAISKLSGLLVGFRLPTAIGENQPSRWTLRYDNGEYIGHLIWVRGYSHIGLLGSSWGKNVVIPWTFLDTFADEAWAVVSRQDWLTTIGKSPLGDEISTLLSDLAKVSS